MTITTRPITENQMLKLFEEAESCMDQGTTMTVDPDLMMTFLLTYAISRKSEISGTRR